MPEKSAQFQVELVFPDESSRAIQIDHEQHIWDAAFQQGIVLPALCHQGYCLTCAGRLEAEGEVDQSDSLAYFPEDRDAGFTLLCTAKARSNLKIRTDQQNQMREFRRQRNLPAPYSWQTE